MVTEQHDPDKAATQDVLPLTREEIGVELHRLYRSSSDERVKLRCLELALDSAAPPLPAEARDPIRQAMLRIRAE